jgi:opacity protein-like surface antigen
MNRAMLAVVLATVLALSAGSRRAAAGEFGISLEGGYFGMTNASKSAKAIFDGSSGGFTGGGSLRYVLGRSFFMGVGARYFTRTGERVFLADATSTPFRLGHPLTIREVPVYGMVGWRFLPDSRFVPYVALGAGSTSFKEKSVVGGLEESQSQSKFSGHFMAGVEWGRGVVRLGAEVMYTTVPDTIGVLPVSKIYGEKDVGGLSFVGKIVLVP